MFLVLFEIELVSFVDQAASDEFSEFPTVIYEHVVIFYIYRLYFARYIIFKNH